MNLFSENFLSKRLKAIFCFVVSSVIAWVVPFKFAPPMEALLHVDRPFLLGYVLWFGLSLAVLLEVVGAYEFKGFRSPLRQYLAFLLASSGAALSLLIIFWIIEYQFIGRYVIGYSAMGAGTACYVLLLGFEKLSKNNPPKILLLVDGKNASAIMAEAKALQKNGVWYDRKALSSEDSLEQFCAREGIDWIVLDHAVDSEKTQILDLLATGVSIFSLVQFWENFFQKIPAHCIDNSWLIRLDLKLRNPFTHKLRRLMDFLLASCCLILSFPFLVLIALIIVLESGLPIFFAQERVGAFGKTYRMYKLRTMKVDAEASGAKWASFQDDRITHVGHFLRKFRIDEIPQFWNIMKGEMSIVGPRPERPEFIDQLRQKVPHWSSRNLLKPGLTGWAQILHTYSSDISSSEEKLAYDLYYLKNASFLLDLEIILSTLRSLTKGSR
jgi:exopolysaccharide biosynthesis polyprenyl glycosylphosphotransferase